MFIVRVLMRALVAVAALSLPLFAGQAERGFERPGELGDKGRTLIVALGGTIPAPTPPAAAPLPARPPTIAVAEKTEPGLPAAPIGRRVALVIGNAGYSDVGRLPTPRNDARAVAATLRSLGFSDVTEAPDLGLAAMTQALEAFGGKAQGADWAVMYFAGHGLQMAGVNYLVPVDARLQRDTDIAGEAVMLSRVLDQVSGARQLKLVILDACRTNPFIERMVRSSDASRSVGRGFAPVEPDGDLLVSLAAKHGTTADDGAAANSPFTAALVEILPTPGLDVRPMFGRVRDSVRKSTNGRQESWLYGSPGGAAFYFQARK